ncbi:type I-E CRISPR-associated protein Cse1/CasA [Mageeibacillus indolicus]|uniref:Type I-E CRISPR-associated protein Cse1/CasA n=1 Tax=Mageeibacillus indolicus TaxID=884684 RepID=A0A2J8AZT9_9FIRM|nr:type I-E CRISPR-associated protein Cse1/CasA [Mageeibacillus indolicus]PNH18029.1 type I-E CRISPR-associated protein Cse1/CasA [Mageeibacillus indolicus]
MSEFNLIDEPWISVLTDYKGTTKLVGLKTLFENASEYIALAGDMATQDFAVMRVILAILHTVFSRYDAQGNAYEEVQLNDRMQQIEKVDLEDKEDYEDALMKTWKDLWATDEFPEIVVKYLETWHDRFYLLDERYPFFQVTKQEVAGEKLSQSKPSEISGKNMNRLISESSNKTALFSPKSGSGKHKELLSYDEVARWLITFQAYTGLMDKVIYGKEKYKASKGWLFDLGGIYLSGKNLYQTLLLNLKLVDTSNSYYNINIQNPCWENAPAKSLQKALRHTCLDNLAELYTIWSRAIYIEKYSSAEAFIMQVVKIPEITHENNFLEPMSLWKYNYSGENKDKFTPRKHRFNESIWRSFGLITQTRDNGGKDSKRKPGIIEWLNSIDESIKNQRIRINAVSMEDDGNSTSWVPTNEIEDRLDIGEYIVNDLQDNGWAVRINGIVDRTRYAVEIIYRSFINDIATIRNIKPKDFTSHSIESMYFEIDKPFRDWLTGIDYGDDKDEKERMWNRELRELIQKQAKNILDNSCMRDFTGVIENNVLTNIATAYNRLLARIKNLR